jgi:hypothetical protein
MPLEGEYAPSPVAQAAEQVAGYEASGGTQHNTMRGQPVVILTTSAGTAARCASHR